MPLTTRTLRLFVSSTFEDLVEERNALHRQVFPELAKLCEQHGTRFQAVDLRWGIRDEAAADQRTMSICLAEIERCERTGLMPHFIILLGSHYGWRPLPARIEANEFQTLVAHVSAADRPLLAEWYRRDDNAVPPEYLLAPRGEEYLDLERWRAVETRLHRALRHAATGARLPSPARVKYEASATHQEILRGLEGTAGKHRHVFAFCRSHDGTVEDPDLGALKIYLRRELGDNVLDYAAGDLAGFCTLVSSAVRSAIVETSSPSHSGRAQEEYDAHERFAADRGRHFVGRKPTLDAIAEYISGKDDRPLILRGPSGVGKSAVIAKASGTLAGCRAGSVVLRRFVGASPASSNGLGLLRDVCQDIARAYGREVTEHLTRFEQAAAELQRCLEFATAGQPLVLFVDAVDQLDDRDPAADLTWLPGRLPPCCRVVVSTTPGRPELPSTMKIVEVAPLAESEVDEALAGWLAAAGRTLSPVQSQTLTSRCCASGLPLFMKLAFEEARLWRSFDRPDACTLAEGLDGQIDYLVARLSDAAHHGPVLVQKGLGYLISGRYGLIERELVDLLSSDDDVWEDFRSRSHHDPGGRELPAAVWSRFLLDLEPYLAERAVPGGTALIFFHRQFAHRIASTLLAENGPAPYHTRLAEYFQGQRLRSNTVDGIPLRVIDELAWQLAQAGSWGDLHALLGDLDLLAAIQLRHDLARDEELHSHWTCVERELSATMRDRYADVFARPDDYCRWEICLDDFTVTPAPAVQILSRLAKSRGQLAPALALMEAYEQFLRGSRAAVGNRDEWIRRCLVEQSNILRELGENKRAEQILKGLGSSDDDAHTLNVRATVLCNQGDIERALPLLEQAEAICRRTQDSPILATVLVNQAFVYTNRDDYERAWQVLAEAEDIAMRLHDREAVAQVKGNQGVVLRLLGHPSRALHTHQEQEALARELGHTRLVAESLYQQALVYSERGESGLALVKVAAAEELSRSMGYRWLLQACLGLQADLQAALPENLETVLAKLDEQERIVKSLGDSRTMFRVIATRNEIRARLAKRDGLAR